MTSPTSTTFRMSDLNNNYRGLDWIGFKVDTFVNNYLAGGPMESPYFQKVPTEEEIEEFRNYCYVRGYKLRLKSDEYGVYAKTTSRVHEAPTSTLSGIFGTENSNRSGDAEIPFLRDNTADNAVNGRVFQPDFQTKVYQRQHNSANFVEETDYLAHQGAAVLYFNQKLIAFITGTEDVMVVLGIKIYDWDPITSTFPALALLYERQFPPESGPNGVPVLTHLVSFGSSPLLPAQILEWNAITGNHPIQGVGFGGPPCNALNRANAPYVIYLNEERMLCRNVTQPFQFGVGALALTGADVALHLFDIQRSLMYRFT